MSTKLTDKQKAFCEEYMIDLNATQAAIRAGYSEKTAKDIACENLAKPYIAAYLVVLKAQRTKRCEVSADDIVKHLDILRRARIDEYVTLVRTKQNYEDPDTKEIKTSHYTTIEFKPFEELTEEQLMCIESVKNGKSGIELKLHGKEWTIEKLSRHIGLYEADNKQIQPVNETPITVIYNDKKIDLSFD